MRESEKKHLFFVCFLGSEIVPSKWGLDAIGRCKLSDPLQRHLLQVFLLGGVRVLTCFKEPKAMQHIERCRVKDSCIGIPRQDIR